MLEKIISWASRTLTTTITVSGLLFIFVANTTWSDASTETEINCQNSEGFRFICGPVAAEDIVSIKGSPWMITSGLNVGVPAHLYAVNSVSEKFLPLFPSAHSSSATKKPYVGNCPSPPNVLLMSFSGLSILQTNDVEFTLYATNDGDRHSVEVFHILSNDKGPRATWVGCYLLPEDKRPNSVAALANNYVLASSFYNPQDEAAEWQKMARGEATGTIIQFNPNYFEMDLGPLSGSNGLALSTDRKTLYISTWSAGKLVIYDLEKKSRRDIKLSFLPDNISVLPDETLLIAGQKTDVQSIADCSGPTCIQPWQIALLDPKTDSITELLVRPGSKIINYATGALIKNGKLFIVGRGENRIAVFPIDKLPLKLQ